MSFRIFIFLLGFGLTVIGCSYIITYLNLTTIGYSLYDTFLYITKRVECLMSLLGILLIILSTSFLRKNSNKKD